MWPKVRFPGVLIVAFLNVLSFIPTIAIAQQSTPTTANPTLKTPKSILGPETTQDADPFARDPAPKIKSSTERDPFDPFLREVAKSRDEPIDYASLKSSDLEKAEAKLRLLRVSLLQSSLNVLETRFASGIGTGGPDLRLHAETMNDLVTLEMEIAKTSSDRQASIQRARKVWRDLEQIEALKRQSGMSRDATASLHAANQRLRWEQALVKELRSESSKKAVVPPKIQHSSIQHPIVQPSSIITDQPNAYYYPSQPSYRYQRNYRTR